MAETQFVSGEIAQHYVETIETLDEIGRIDRALGKGVREMADDGRKATLGTPDVEVDGETMTYVTVVDVGDRVVAVTDAYETEDFAWAGDETLIEAIEQLVDGGHLTVVEDELGIFD